MFNRRLGTVALALAVVGGFAITAASEASPQLDRIEAKVDLLLEAHDITTTTAPPTTTAAPTTTAPTTTTAATVQISVTVFNGNRARVSVVPNSAVVTIRNPAGTIVSTGRSGDVPAQFCCTAGTYTWSAVADAGFVAAPSSGSFTVAAVTTTTGATTTTTVASTTTTVVPTTTTTVQPGEASYVNPPNTGNKVPENQLTVINGDLNISTDQHIENLLILGKLRVFGGAVVTAENITIRADEDSYAAGIRVEGSGTRLTISHFTVTHTSSGWSQRGIGVSGGGWGRFSFGDISGTEDGLNTNSPHSAGQIIFEDSWVHHLKGSPPGGINPSPPHHDGIQVMGGNVLLDRMVFEDIQPSTAAIFPKSDFNDVTLTVRDTYASGGGFTIYRGDECCGFQVVTVFDNVEANPYPISNCGSCGGPGSRWGAVRGVTGGATSTGAITVVDWHRGDPGWHPGNQT